MGRTYKLFLPRILIQELFLFLRYICVVYLTVYLILYLHHLSWSNILDRRISSCGHIHLLVLLLLVYRALPCLILACAFNITRCQFWFQTSLETVAVELW